MTFVGRLGLWSRPATRATTNVKCYLKAGILRRFSTDPAPSAPLEDASKLPPIPPMPRIIHPDWYRTPLAEDDPRMIGDYPAVEAVSQQLRPAYDPTYFDPQNRRHWGEPIPEDYEPLLMWSVDCETQYGAWWLVGSLGGFFGGMFLLYSWLNKVPSPLFDFTAPKELPTVGKYFPDGKIPKSLTHMSPSMSDFK